MTHTKKPQNYKSHRRLIPLYHFFLFGLILITFIGAVNNLIRSAGNSDRLYSAALLVSVSVILIFMFFFARRFALRAQDRAIRAEENFRHYVLTGKPLNSNLKMSQIIALRFAPDEEFPELANETVSKNLSNSEIKQAIQKWKADHHRV